MSTGCLLESLKNSNEFHRKPVWLAERDSHQPLFYLYFCLWRVARGVLIPRPGIKSKPPALEARSLNHGTTREVPQPSTFYFSNPMWNSSVGPWTPFSFSLGLGFWFSAPCWEWFSGTTPQANAAHGCWPDWLHIWWWVETDVETQGEFYILQYCFPFRDGAAFFLGFRSVSSVPWPHFELSYRYQ